MPDTYALPFELTAVSIDKWLVTFDALSYAEKVNQLNKIITELSQSSLEASALFLVLDKLTETFLMLSNILEHMATNEKKTAFPDKVKKNKILAIQMPKKLCFTYAKLSNEITITNEQQMLCIYRAMQILCLLIKRNTLFYEAPDATLWKKLAELYLKAETSYLLDADIVDSVSGLASQPTIQAVAKQALFFYICNAYFDSPSDINAIFSAVADLADRLMLDKEPSELTPCYWNPYSQLPPLSVSPENREEQALYLDTSKIIGYFESNTDQFERYQVLAPALMHLTAYAEIRRSVNPSVQTDCNLIIGIPQALRFVTVLTSRYRILELSGAFQHQSKSSRLELVPMEDDNNHLAFLSAKILKDDASFSVSKIKTYQTANPFFCTAKVGNIDCSMDEPVILSYKNQRPCFAVIRHIRVEASIKLKNLLIEIIDGAVYVIEVEGHQGFIIARSFDKTELFLPRVKGLVNVPEIFSATTISDRNFRIEKFIELTAHYSRYQVCVC